jgi:hypothetical protein
MDQANLAELLTTANEAEQQSLLMQYVELADVRLGWALKSLYDNVESSDPSRAAKVSTALASLAR